MQPFRLRLALTCLSLCLLSFHSLALCRYYKQQSRAQLGGLRGSPTGRGGGNTGPTAPAMQGGAHHIKILPPSMDEYEDDDDVMDDEGLAPGGGGGVGGLMPHKLEQIKSEVSTYMDRKRIQAEEEAAADALLQQRLTGGGKQEDSPKQSKRRVF